jgi:hypothetical protein
MVALTCSVTWDSHFGEVYYFPGIRCGQAVDTEQVSPRLALSGVEGLVLNEVEGLVPSGVAGLVPSGIEVQALAVKLGGGAGDHSPTTPPIR